MKSKYINLKEHINLEELNEPAQSLRQGELVLFPTETVYGIGANALDAEAVKKIFVAKGRESDNPLIAHIADIDMLYDLVENVGEIENKLINNFWPGPLTIIFKKKEVVPNIVTAGLNTVAVRMPSNIIAKEFIKKAGVPIAAPSANISGRPSGTKVEDILNELDGKVAYIIDGGTVEIGVESTVIRVVENKVHILRPGKITVHDLENIGLEVIVEKHVLGEVKPNEKVMSPGMKYRHYAPNTKCLLVYSQNEKDLINKIREVAEENNNVLILCKDKNLDKYDVKYKLGMGNTIEEITKNIFTLLRKVDSYKADLTIIEGVDKTELGLAVMNRLIRACGHNYIEIDDCK